MALFSRKDKNAELAKAVAEEIANRLTHGVGAVLSGVTEGASLISMAGAGTAAALIGMRGTFVAAGVLCLVGGVVTALLVTGAVREQTRRS